jgi:hypothetical protein
MKKWSVALALAAGMVCSSHACEDKTAAASPQPAEAKTAQQSKMKQCNEQAKGKTGDERKAFMKECLSKKA